MDKLSLTAVVNISSFSTFCAKSTVMLVEYVEWVDIVNWAA